MSKVFSTFCSRNGLTLRAILRSTTSDPTSGVSGFPWSKSRREDFHTKRGGRRSSSWERSSWSPRLFYPQIPSRKHTKTLSIRRKFSLSGFGLLSMYVTESYLSCLQKLKLNHSFCHLKTPSAPSYNNEGFLFRLKKKVSERGTYLSLLEHPFLQHHAMVNRVSWKNFFQISLGLFRTSFNCFWI